MAEQNTNGLVIHISSLNDRSTEVVMLDRITIGASEDCDVKIRALQGAAATSNGPLIELARLNGVYRIASLDPNVEIKFNGRPVKSNKGINDGDEIWIGPSGPSIHFFPIASASASLTKPDAAVGSSPTSKPNSLSNSSSCSTRTTNWVKWSSLTAGFRTLSRWVKCCALTMAAESV